MSTMRSWKLRVGGWRTTWTLWAFVGLLACDGSKGDLPSPTAPDPDPTPNPTTDPAWVEPVKSTVGVGSTVTLTAFVPGDEDDLVPGAGVTWTSSSTGVATVNAAGVVTGVGDGTTTITARVGDREGTATITVGAGAIQWAQITAGGKHNCGVTTGGEAYCWGYGSFVGDGATVSSSVPVRVGGGHTWVKVAAGNSHTCGLTTGGDVYCWGGGEEGQLGHGSFDNSISPVLVTGGHKFVDLEAGRIHTCAVRADGQAYCWGWDVQGALGDGGPVVGTEENKADPVPVAGNLQFAEVNPGPQSTCGVTGDGAGYCWGLGLFGVLGNGVRGDGDPNMCGRCVKEPIVVRNAPSFQSIDTGGNLSCGVSTDGDLYCWGGSAFPEQPYFTEWMPPDHQGFFNIDFPVPVPSDAKFVTNTSGTWTQCALALDGLAHCMALAVNGGPGNGRYVLTPVATDLTFVSLDSGTDQRQRGARDHTCGVTTEGRAFCWGQAWVGDGTDALFLFPVQVPDP